MRRAENFLALFDFPLDGAGESEIADLGLGVEIEKDVGRLDVAVDDAVFVGVGESAADGGDEADHFRRVDRLAMGRVIDRLPGHELHHDVKHPVDFAEVIHADEVRVIEAGHRLGLGLEALAKRSVLAEFHRQDFQRDRPIQRLLHRAIDGTHASGRDEALDFIPREKRREVGGLRSNETGRFVRVGHVRRSGNLQSSRWKPCFAMV